MITWIFIGIFGGPERCRLYRDLSGQVPQFRNEIQANQFIIENGLGIHASPIEVSEYELLNRR